MGKRTEYGPGIHGTVTSVDLHDHASPKGGGGLSASAFGGSNPFGARLAVAATGAITTANVAVNPRPGQYLVSVYVEVTAKTANGIITVTIGWTDAVGATTDASVTQSVIGTGRFRGAFPVKVSSGNVTYAVAVGTFTGSYTVSVALEQL